MDDDEWADIGATARFATPPLTQVALSKLVIEASQAQSSR